VGEDVDNSLPPTLRVDRLVVQFRQLIAVNHVTFELHGGQFLGLLGPNGAGKTTLMRAICGLQPVRSGDVYLHGQPLSESTVGLLRHLGFTPDTPPVYEQMTVRQFLRFIGRQYQLPADEVDDRIAFWLDKLWLTEKADARIKGLSRGMRQRIGIARTMLPNPDLVVLDEPAAGLDPAGRAQFRQLLADLRNQGKALIVSSHVLSDLAEHCTHVGLMNGGRMLRFEPVAKFLGDVAASVEGDGRCEYRATLAGSTTDVMRLAHGIAGVHGVSIDGETLTFSAGRQPAEAAAVLRELIAAGIKIASFAPRPANLEEAYLRASDGRPLD